MTSIKISGDFAFLQAPAKKFSVKKLIIIFAIIAVVAIVGVIVANMLTISKAEYDKIEVGMSYDEVVKIIGCKGELTDSSEELNSEVYAWRGLGGGHAEFLFVDGKVWIRFQEGLK